jgi:hypothetical protein
MEMDYVSRPSCYVYTVVCHGSGFETKDDGFWSGGFGNSTPRMYTKLPRHSVWDRPCNALQHGELDRSAASSSVSSDLAAPSVCIHTCIRHAQLRDDLTARVWDLSK